MQTDEQAATPSHALSLGMHRFGGFIRRGLMALGAVAAMAAPAAAQQGMLQPGTAVVTGFSGFYAYPGPEGSDPFAYTSINTSGPSARVIDLTNPGPQGVESPAEKLYTLNAGQVGQVFGVTIDNTPTKNFYLGATSAYGLSIYVVDENSSLKRVQQGEPGAQFVPGQFGPPEQGGGPGSIWRVAGDTGEVTLFANIDGGVGSVAGLGGLAFHAQSQQIFAVERGTGIIYRLGLNGQIRGKYDHGVEGRPSAGFAPIPLTPPLPADINSPTFNPGNPATYGLAPPARRVFAVAVYNNRLYYSVAQGPQIWSASIAPSGAIPGRDARMEIELPSLQDGVEISSITFDPQGRMYVAERGATTGDFYLYTLADAGNARVQRYVPKPPGDPSPGRWRLQPDQYSVGLAPIYNNANGGVALSYGYNASGTLNPNSCGTTVWSTGERLLDPGDGTPDFPIVDGLQGNLATLFQPQNSPPTASWFIDYNDQASDPNFRGYMGAIATPPCVGAPTPPPPPPMTCPAGTYFSNGQCLIYPTCPPGTNFINGQCVYPQCPPGFVMQGGQCVPPPVVCPPNTYLQNGQCKPLLCPPGLMQTPNGYCVCPQGMIYANGQCVPPNLCPPGAINIGGICICPLGLILQNGQCLPFQCPPGQTLNIQGQCMPIICPPGQELKNGQCVPLVCPPGQEMFKGQCVPKCPLGTTRQPDGSCKPFELCLPPKEIVKGECVPPCPPGQFRQPDGSCKGLIFCLAPNELVNGQCVPPCPPLTQRQPDGSCKPNIIVPPIFCLPNQDLVNGECKPKCGPNQIRLPNGICIPKPVIQPPVVIDPPVLCLAPNQMVNGNCMPPCGPNQIRLPNGVCIPKPVIQPPPKPPKPPVIIDPPVLCLAPNELVNGNCVPKCGPNQIRLPNGVCIPKPVIQPPPKPPKPPVIINPPKPPMPKPPVVIDPPIIVQPPVVIDPPKPRPPKPPVIQLPDPPVILKPPVIQLPENNDQPRRCPPGQMRNDNGECVRRLLNPNIQIKPNLQIQPQIEPQMQMEMQPNG